MTDLDETPRIGRSWLTANAYSSGIRLVSVVRRNVALSVSSSNAPIVTFVFPISIANSM